MKSVLIPDRWERIIELVDAKGGATVEQIAEALQVSPATVRRDLERIQQRGLITRTRGGAAPCPHVRVGPTLSESRRTNPEEKEWIGSATASLVEDGDILMIDGGFTTFQVACNLTASDVSVVTNSLDAIQTLIAMKGITVVVLGGELNLHSGATMGSVTEADALRFRADKAILGVDAISVEEGLTCANPLSVPVKKAMIRCARELIVVADHSKLGRFALHEVSPLQAVTTLVTDDKADQSILDGFRNAGIEVIVASHDSKV